METKQAQFNGWAVVELFGHAKEIGFVTTQYFGTACLFQVDVPALPEREYVLTRPEYLSHGDGNGLHWTPEGSKVKRAASPGRSPLIGPGSIYKLTPCTEATAMTALEEFCPRPLMLLELAKKSPQLLPGEEAPEKAQDRTFTCCGGNPEDGHADDCIEEEEEEERI
jgi:hypothetical protein